MIIGLLVCTIGIIPIVLALSVRKIYKGSDLSLGLLLFMVLVSIWQADIGVLYFKGLLDEKWILFYFRLFRMGPTFAVPAVYYVAYVMITKHSPPIKETNSLNKLLAVVFSRTFFFGFMVWSTIIYFFIWTNWSISGLKVVKVYRSNIEFYFPEYGPLSWLYIFHMSTFTLIVFFVFILSRSIQNQSIKEFLRTFSVCSLLLFIPGFLNFVPGTGAVAGSIGVIIFSVTIMFAFIKMNTVMTLHYHQLMERQKKLDYTGNLTGSLIHEVGNTVQVIKGFTKMLNNSGSLSKSEIQYIDIIDRAVQQLNDLAINYRDYMKHSKLDFKMEDLNQIIERSIELSREMVKEHQITLEFTKKYYTLKAYVNKTYLQQVFVNLIKNSTEAFTPDRFFRKITIDTDIVGESIVIHVQDTGRGIPPQNWESIFDPFISSKAESMGLGLPFVRKIIFEHRGNIHVVKSSSAGTLFEIKLPQFEFSDLDNVQK